MYCISYADQYFPIGSGVTEAACKTLIKQRFCLAGMRWKFADSDDDDTLTNFADAFDNANGRRGVAWNLTIGLYWSRP